MVFLHRKDGNYTSSVDRALYYSYLAYQSASEKYHCYAIPAHTSKESTYPYGVSFMKYLGGNKEASFNEIKNDILYLIDTGSYVEDYMAMSMVTTTSTSSMTPLN